MDKQKHLKTLSSQSFLIAVLFSACVNQIETEIVKESSIPINFSAGIKQAVSIRVTDAGFENGDKIGLFATLTGTSLGTERYIDNLSLEYNSILVPEKTVFYPEGNAALDFTAYYPYQQDGLQTGSTVLPISVQTDQSTAKNHSASDFLVATQNNISSSNEVVSLSFRHRLSKLKVTLVPQEGENLEEMLKSSPKIVASGFFTKADYDLISGEISNTSAAADIIASGKWTQADETLVGKEIIVIPQHADADNQSIIIEWNGGIYTCPISKIDLESNTQRVIKIAISQADHTLAGIVGEIESWGTETTQEDGKGDLQTNEIHTSALSFNTSNIYRIYHQGRAIAEICKEYLQAENAPIASQAIVVYPVMNERTDLTAGTVLQLCGESRNLHGGTASWDTAANTLTYTAGTSAPIEKFYISKSGKIITATNLEETQSVNISKYVLHDVRQSKSQAYALVKIGTQYWMREELKATCYQDGTEIKRQTTLTDHSETGYYLSDEYGFYFYNGETLLKGNLAPQGWRVPQTEDWKKMQTYLKDEAALLKAGTWELLEGKGTLAAVSNLTGFNAYPIGMWRESGHKIDNYMTGYWTLDEEEGGKVIPAQTIFLTADAPQFVFSDSQASGKNYLKVISIRCIKE